MDNIFIRMSEFRSILTFLAIRFAAVVPDDTFGIRIFI
jgi:hypothetical protein